MCHSEGKSTFGKHLSVFPWYTNCMGKKSPSFVPANTAIIWRLSLTLSLGDILSFNYLDDVVVIGCQLVCGSILGSQFQSHAITSPTTLHSSVCEVQYLPPPPFLILVFPWSTHWDTGTQVWSAQFTINRNGMSSNWTTTFMSRRNWSRKETKLGTETLAFVVAFHLT